MIDFSRKDCELLDERNARLVDAVKEVSLKYEDVAYYISTRRIVEMAIRKPTPRFYVSLDWAMNVYNTYRLHGFIKTRRDESTEQFEEILSRLKTYLKDNDCTVRRAMECVLNTEAPKMYITAESAYRIYNKMMK